MLILKVFRSIPLLILYACFLLVAHCIVWWTMLFVLARGNRRCSYRRLDQLSLLATVLFVILSRSRWPGQHCLLPFVGLITMLHTPAAIARIAPKIAQLFRRMPTSSSKLPTKAYLLPGVESNTSLGYLFSHEQGKNDKHATFDSLIGLSTGEERTIVRLHMNHLKGPASFVTVKKKEGKVLKGPQSAFVAIGIEVPVLRQPPPVLQASLDMQMGSLSPSFREKIMKFNR